MSLLCTLTFRSRQYGRCVPITVLFWQEGGASRTNSSPTPPETPVIVSAMGNSPWPTVIPPESVPALLNTRSLAICRLCAQPWTKTPPPPWELLVMLRPSIEDGLQMKLLG